MSYFFILLRRCLCFPVFFRLVDINDVVVFTVSPDFVDSISGGVEQ